MLFDATLYKETLYNIDIQLTKIFKQYLKPIDPFNVNRNKKLMQAFILFFREVNLKMPASGKEGFFVAPLHRIFSYYFTRLVMHNYFHEIKDSVKAPNLLFKDIFRRYVDIPLDQNAWTYLQTVATIVIRPLARSYAFIHEILAGKWVMSGLFV